MEKILKTILNWLKRFTLGVNPTAFILICFVLLGVVAVVKYFRIDSSSSTRTIQIKVVGENWTNSYRQYEGSRPPYWYEEKLHKGLEAYAGQGRVIAKVESVERYQRDGPDYDVYLVVTVSGYTDSTKGQYIFNGQPVIVGRQIRLEFASVELVGDIIDADYSSSKEITDRKVISVIQKGVPLWQLNSYHIGDTSSNGIETIAEIIKITKRPSSLFDLYMRDNSVKLKQHNDLYDIEMSIKILVNRHAGEWYYGGHQRVSIGSDIWISLENTDISGATITSVSEDE